MREQNSNIFTIIFPILTFIGIGILIVYSIFYEPSCSFNWEGIRKEIKDSVIVARDFGISSGIVGINARKPKQFDRRFWIMENATESELFKLMEYPNGTIKAIAYEGLIRNKDFDNKLELVLKSIQDTTNFVNYKSGCSGWQIKLSEYLVQYVLKIDSNLPPFPPEEMENFGISDNDQKIILTAFYNGSKIN